MLVRRPYVVCVSVCALAFVLCHPSRVHADAPPSPSASAIPALGVDPCSMLAVPDVASALGVAIGSVGKPQRPSANECIWAAGARTGTAGRTVTLSFEAARSAKSPCHGFGCVALAQSLSAIIPGAHVLPPQLGPFFSDAQTIAGLGERASWKDGWLNVLKSEMLFRLQVTTLGSDAARLATSQSLAQAVLGRL